MGAVCAGDSGQLTSVAFSAAQSVQAIRLHTLAQGSVTYEYSIDGGASWHAIRDGRDAWFDVPQRSVQIRANLSGAGTILQGLDVTGVYEMNPVRFKGAAAAPSYLPSISPAAVSSPRRCLPSRRIVRRS